MNSEKKNNRKNKAQNSYCLKDLEVNKELKGNYRNDGKSREEVAIHL